MSALQVMLRLYIAAFTVETVLSQAQRPPSLTSSLPVSTHYFSPNSGEILTLPCEASGSPEPNYRWEFNGKILNVTPKNKGTLVFENPDIERQGYYQCFVENSLGMAVSNKTLVLKATQAAFDQAVPVRRTATAGQKLKLPCVPSVSSVPPPSASFNGRSFDWKIYEGMSSTGSQYPLNRRVQIDDNGNLNFAYIIAEDGRPEAVLKCDITNRISNINVGGSGVVLTVKDDGTATAVTPEIMFYPNSSMNSGSDVTTVVALEKSNTSLRCFFSGSEAIEVSWKKERGQMPTDGRVSQHNHKIELYITNVRKSDEGVYVCTGTGVGGSTDFKINFIVQAEPVFKTPASRPGNVNATVGEDVIFQCNPHANPSATIHWYRNGALLDKESQTELLNNFRWSADNRELTVLKMCKSNCTQTENRPMVIQCNASNEHGYAFANGYVNVFEKTKFKERPEAEIILKPHATLTLLAHATSDPWTTVTYEWTRDNERLISDGERVRITVGEDGVANLTIVDVDHSDYGEYKCRAMNGISEDLAVTSVAEHKVANIWPMIAVLMILLILVIIFAIACFVYRNRGEDYPVDETERKQGNNPEQDLEDNNFQPFQRKETGSDAGSTISRNSLDRLEKRTDEETGLIRDRSGSLGGTFN